MRVKEIPQGLLEEVGLGLHLEESGAAFLAKGRNSSANSFNLVKGLLQGYTTSKWQTWI